MPDLAMLQERMRAAILGQDDPTLGDAILADDLSAAERLDVYRNNTFVSLKTALKDAFPAVCRLVDERFFLYAADEFIRAFPPEQPRLAVYGERFANFLATFPPSAHLPYLADVARLEWMLRRAANAADATPLTPSALAVVGEAHMSDLTFRLDPSLGLLASPWPVDAIWRANRPGGGTAAAIDLDGGAVWLEIRRVGDEVVLHPLDAATFAFRAALARGERLEAAADAALAQHADFDLAAGFADLFREGAVVAFGCAAPARRR
ncbi:MAG TPA: DNA-binding domain-containing protein [Stellaceae bacterium]|nr:DNA-binding domain-containing protein [Stellaceae bacterium]